MEPEKTPRAGYHAYRPRSFDDEARDVTPLEQPAPSADFLPTVDPEKAEGEEPGQDFRPGQGSPGSAGAGRAEGSVDFASLKFQREATLLTNAEDYANSIRQEAELYVSQIRVEAEDLNQQSELRYQEAQQAKELAEQEAAQRVAQAHAEADGVREQAYQEGLAAGQQEGLRRRYEEAQVNLVQLEQILQEMSSFRRRVNFQVEKDGVRLAVLLAKKILRQELKVNRKAVLQLLARTLSELEDTGTFRVWMNPADLEFALAARKALEKFMGEDQSLSLRAKPDLAPGNVQIESDREVIDLTIESQLHHLDALLTQTLNERESVVTRAGTGLDIPGPPGEAEPEGDAPAAETSPDEEAPADV